MIPPARYCYVPVSIPRRYAKNGTGVGFFVWYVVSIPRRYAKNGLPGDGDVTGAMVSIPRRYAKNT